MPKYGVNKFVKQIIQLSSIIIHQLSSKIIKLSRSEGQNLKGICAIEISKFLFLSSALNGTKQSLSIIVKKITLQKILTDFYRKSVVKSAEKVQKNHLKFSTEEIL